MISEAIQQTAAKQLPADGEPIHIVGMTMQGTAVVVNDDLGGLTFCAADAFADYCENPNDVVLVDGSRTPVGSVNRAVLHGLLDLWIDRKLKA